MDPTAQKSSEVVALYDRINLLERRCCYLQGKVNVRPLAKVNPNADLSVESGIVERPDWEAWLVNKIGAKGADLVVFMYCFMDAWLRKFTQRLLRRDMWLWVFYAHLLVLYTIAGSCYAETFWASEPDIVSAINVGIDKAQAKNAAAHADGNA